MGILIYLFEEKLLAHKRHIESNCKIWHSCCGDFGCPKCHPSLGGMDKSLPNGDRLYENVWPENLEATKMNWRWWEE